MIGPFIRTIHLLCYKVLCQIFLSAVTSSLFSATPIKQPLGGFDPLSFFVHTLWWQLGGTWIGVHTSRSFISYSTITTEYAHKSHFYVRSYEIGNSGTECIGFLECLLFILSKYILMWSDLGQKYGLHL